MGVSSELSRLPVTAAILAAKLPEGSWHVPAQIGLTLVVAASWLCLLAYRRQFDGAPQPPSRVIGGPTARMDAAESRTRAAASTVPAAVGDGG